MYTATMAYKRRHFNMQRRRSKRQATNKLKESTTYESSIDLSANAHNSVDEIPEPVNIPIYTQLTKNNLNVICFDLDTTSLNKSCNIIQLSACIGNDTFNRYVVPHQMITEKATDVTGLTFFAALLYHHGKRVEAVPIRKCFQQFVEWLQQYKPVLLTAHNCKLFDAYRLLYQMQEYAADLRPMFADIVEGFADTLPLFRHLFKEELFNFKLETVAKHILGSDLTFDSHNAEADVLTLQATECTRSYQLTDQFFSITSSTTNQTRQMLEHKYRFAATTNR